MTKRRTKDQKKDRQYNGQKKKDRQYNDQKKDKGQTISVNDLQNIHIKLKIQ